MERTTTLEQLAARLGLTPNETVALLVVTGFLVIVVWVWACWTLSRAVTLEGERRPPATPLRRARPTSVREVREKRLKGAQ